MHYRFNISGRDFAVEVAEQSAGRLRVSVNGNPYDVAVVGETASAAEGASAGGAGCGPLAESAAVTPTAPAVAPETSPGAILAPIPGLILEVRVRVGDSVLAGQAVAVMEAMKMENNLVSNVSGVVTEILVQKGAEVATGDVILRLDVQG